MVPGISIFRWTTRKHGFRAQTGMLYCIYLSPLLVFNLGPPCLIPCEDPELRSPEQISDLNTSSGETSYDECGYRVTEESQVTNHLKAAPLSSCQCARNPLPESGK